MPKTFLRTLTIGALMARSVAFAGYGGSPQPVTAIAQKADAIVLATATAVKVNEIDNTAAIALSIVGTLKGRIGTANLHVDVDLSGGSPQFTSLHGVDANFFEASVTGSSGAWFLRLDQAGYHVVPFSIGAVQPENLFLRENPGSLATIPAGTLNQ